MNQVLLGERLEDIRREDIPFLGQGKTRTRHLRLFEIGREDLTLAKLAEAHWDALSILAEAGRQPVIGSLYAVWASEASGKTLSIVRRGSEVYLEGTKNFCSGLGIVDRALVTVSAPDHRIVDIDLRRNRALIDIDTTGWQSEAFQMTNTGSVVFRQASISEEAILGSPGWYLERSGFWNGALGPAACWAGGAAGLLIYAQNSKREDPHTLAHAGAMDANVWGMKAHLITAADEIDADPADSSAAMVRALEVRHLIEQACTDTLRRFTRSYGPYPLSMDREVTHRYQELDLYLRQSHAERDLESLGRALRRDLERVHKRLL